MKLIVLMPSCDWPRGSGLVNPNTPEAVHSVLDSGVEDVELWVKLDGPQPDIKTYLDGLCDKRIRVFDGEKTRSSGNHQRRFLMEQMLSEQRKGLFCFHDDDDAYVDGGLKLMYDISVKNDCCPVLGRHRRPLLDEIHTPEQAEHAGGMAIRFKMPLSFAASLFPIMEGMPMWPEEGGYYADLPYAQKFFHWFEEQGKQIALLETTVSRIRPMDALGSEIPEFH